MLGRKEFDQKSISSFQKLEPILIEYLKASLNPDLVLKNFVRIIRNITFPSLWYNEFQDKKFFQLFLNTCEYSQKAIDLFAEDFDLHELFLTRKVFLKLNKNNVKDFSTKELLFVLSVQFNDLLISYRGVSKILSEYFNEQIKKLAQHSIERELKQSEYFIGAMGSFGAGEMTFASDIDLVFIVKDLEAIPEIHKLFQNFLNTLKINFKPFDVDCRLRPEGVSSPLVWESNSYKNYIFKRARTWEFQSFCKLNFVCGNKKIFNNLIKAVNEKVINEDKQKIKTDMKNMRRKLYPSDLSSLTKIFNVKKSSGGILDIDFIAQLLMLSDFNLFKTCRGKGIIKTMESIVEKNSANDDYISLKQNFIFLKNLELNNQNIYNITTPSLTFNQDNLKVFTRKLGFESVELFQDNLNKIKKENQSLFLKYFS